MSERPWHYEREGQPIGPFPLADIDRLAAAGMIHRETVLCDPYGNRMPAAQTLALFQDGLLTAASPLGTAAALGAAAAADVPPPPPPPLPVSFPAATGTPTLPRAWNPLALFWLGVAFSPIWTGIMAAVNAGRLQTGRPCGGPWPSASGRASLPK